MNDEPPMLRFVVDAVVKDPYVVDESAKRFTPVKELESERSVEEANVHVDVEKLYTRPEPFTAKAPLEIAGKLNAPEIVDDAVEKKPFRPRTVEVELYPVFTVNGKAYDVNPASLVNQESFTVDDAIVWIRPPVPRYAKPCELFGSAIEEVATNDFAVTAPPSKYPEPTTERL
jgi:hypothetical protein